MSPLPRLLAIIGSGETTPTMVRVHRRILGRLGPAPVPAVVLDTPYGFQENADDISQRAVEYFRESVGQEFVVASFRSADENGLARATAMSRIRGARYVFAGPGSPSYALRQWRESEVPGLLAEKLARGGAVVVASAAALTVGLLTVPVYEIYKVGEAPRWLPGLDLLSPLGLRAVVIPHYDNAEGGNHDTRYCYLGERRLEVLERDLPADAFVLGVDGHTALILDLDAANASVEGLGGVTVRQGSRSAVFGAGETLPIAALREAAAGARTSRAAGSWPPGTQPVEGPGAPESPGVAATSPLHAEVAEHEATFEHGLAGRDVPAAVGAVLALEETIRDWSRDTEESGELESARSAFRAAIVRLGELAASGARDPRELVAPYVDALVELRVAARTARDWAAADAIRDRILAAGIELHDGPDGTTWELPAEGPASVPAAEPPAAGDAG